MYTHTKILKKIKVFITQPNVKFAIANLPIRINHGYCITSSGSNKIIIIIDPKKEFFATLIHECLHGLFPTYKEKQIKTVENQIMSKITQKQVLDILQCFCTNAKFLTSLESIQEFI